jgi:hypothetical protein
VWSEPPHSAAVYYVEEEHLMVISALTDRGFHKVVELLGKQLSGMPTEPDIRVNLSMVTCIKDILGKKVILNPYEEMFTVTPDPADHDLMDRLNHLLALALPFINSGTEPDIAALAKQAGVDEETARHLLSKSIKRIKTLQRKVDKK